MGYELATLYADVVEMGEGHKAIKVQKDNQVFWLPKSQVRKLERMVGRNYRIVIPRWLADQKGIKKYYAG